MDQTIAAPCVICLVEAVKGADCRDCNASPSCFRQERRLKRERHVCHVSETLQEQTMSRCRDCAAQELLESGPAEAHCSCDLQAVTDSSCAITAWKADTAAPCSHVPCSAGASHQAALWKCGCVEHRDKHGKAAADRAPQLQDWEAGMVTPLPPAQPGHALLPPALTSWGITHTKPAPSSHSPKTYTHLPDIFISC